MSKSIDFEKLKQQVKVFAAAVHQKFVYLLNCINRFGFGGIAWWFKSHHQRDDLEIALVDLRAELEKEDADLLMVEKIFSDFVIPEEDMGHVYWYTDAHNKLVIFEKKLTEKSVVDIKLLKQAMNELKFIGKANEFHQLYQLQSVQQRVKDMYQELQQKIVEQQNIERESAQSEKQKQVTEKAKAEADKAASLAKAKMMESVKIKEKRLAIIEDKKRHQAEREATAIKIQEQNELAEIKAKQAEVERQSKLQDSYRELEIKEKIKELPLEELIEMVNQEIENKKILTFIQLDQLSKLKHTIEEKKA